MPPPPAPRTPPTKTCGPAQGERAGNATSIERHAPSKELAGVDRGPNAATRRASWAMAWGCTSRVLFACRFWGTGTWRAQAEVSQTDHRQAIGHPLEAGFLHPRSRSSWPPGSRFCWSGIWVFLALRGPGAGYPLQNMGRCVRREDPGAGYPLQNMGCCVRREDPGTEYIRSRDDPKAEYTLQNKGR